MVSKAEALKKLKVRRRRSCSWTSGGRQKTDEGWYAVSTQKTLRESWSETRELQEGTEEKNLLVLKPYELFPDLPGVFETGRLARVRFEQGSPFLVWSGLSAAASAVRQVRSPTQLYSVLV